MESWISRLICSSIQTYTPALERKTS